MKVAELATTVRDAITVSRVFAEPYGKDGVTVVAAATVVGGAGGGGGHDEHGQEGEGGGFGVVARPAGAYVIKDGMVRGLVDRLTGGPDHSGRAHLTSMTPVTTATSGSPQGLSYRAVCRSSS